ncbi:anti-phage dCTP deaminase [Neisseria sp. P0006.S004]|uniref:anti-phage dCTP deaminase n=1 Tax=unclassified Neisseria TaxID=2623750 RepID=UPI003F816F12
MSKYTKNSIEKLYGSDDDFILIGVTGRTGSGCSTVANILNSEEKDLKHSLFQGSHPENNEHRVEKIIFNRFKGSWKPFLLIQVRSIITLMLAESKNETAIEYAEFIQKHISEPGKIEILNSILENINREFENLESTSEGIINFYDNYLPNESKDLKDLLGIEFTALFQEIGDNIRKSGNPVKSTMEEGNFFKLAERINSIIKDIREYHKNKQQPTFIVIDAIRNPLEAFFFQERYASFYLLAITCNDEERKQRLRNLGINDKEIETIDKKEYSSHDLDHDETYTTQDIQACLQRADLYINNKNASDEVTKFIALSNQLIKFTTLMRYPGIINPTSIERCMQIAYTAKLNSGCLSRQVGAAITDSNFSIKAIGWNDVPEGQVSCNLRNRFDLVDGNDSKAFTYFERNDENFINHIKEGNKQYIAIKQYRNTSFCFKSEYNKIKKDKNQVHTRALHAEENAFLQLSKYGGNGIQNGFLFTTASPCELCAKKAYQLGIKRIYYIDPYPGISAVHILQSGSNDPELVLFTGAIGRAFHKLYSPLIPYKDELNALIES